jgi:CBS domain-containing protein
MRVTELVNGPPVSCGSDARVQAVADRMITEEVGSLAVIDEGRLVGIVTDRDIVSAVARSLVDGTVAEIMTTGPDTIDGEMSIEDAIYWLNATGYRHLPVTEDDRLIGIVSIKDLLWATNDPAA